MGFQVYRHTCSSLTSGFFAGSYNRGFSFQPRWGSCFSWQKKHPALPESFMITQRCGVLYLCLQTQKHSHQVAWHINESQSAHHLGSLLSAKTLFTLSFSWAKHLENTGIPTMLFPKGRGFAGFLGGGPTKLIETHRISSAGPPGLELTAKGN